MRKGNAHWKLILMYTLILSLTALFILAGNRAITVISEQMPLYERKIVIIDAGHGGVDGGASSVTGALESHLNLQIAQRLDDLLHLLGVKTVMIRNSDTSIHTHGDSIAEKKVSDLKERVRIVNANKQGILVSIHQNHFSDSRYSGAQVFYAPTAGSKELAETMQTTLKTLNPINNRGAKKADGVYLMQHIENTGVLVECGFLSNIKEEALLREPQYQKKICCAIAASLSAYLAS